MKEVVKRITLVVLMIAMLIILTGCANVNMELIVHSDGSADVTYIMGYDKSFLNSMSVSVDDIAEDDTFSENMENARNEGYTVENYEDENTYGFKASKHVDNIAEFSMKDATGIEENGNIIFEKNFMKTVISQDSTIDLSDALGENNAENEAFFEMLLDNMNMKYKVVLPIKAGENNATTVSEDGKTLEWTLKIGETNQIKFEAKKDYTIFVVVSSVVLIVIALSVIILARKKKKPEVQENEKQEDNITE